MAIVGILADGRMGNLTVALYRVCSVQPVVTHGRRKKRSDTLLRICTKATYTASVTCIYFRISKLYKYPSAV